MHKYVLGTAALGPVTWSALFLCVCRSLLRLLYVSFETAIGHLVGNVCVYVCMYVLTLRRRHTQTRTHTHTHAQTHTLQGVSSAPRRSERRRHRLVCVRVTSLMIAHTRT